MKCAVAIFAKSPVRGAVKTRLCPPLTPDQATDLYRAFLLDTIHIISEIEGIEPGVLFTPADAGDDFRDLAPSHFFLVPQTGDGFGARMAHGFRALFARGFDAVAIMDADSPTLPRAHIAELFEQLTDPDCDVSVGPCDDGGYWALGMKRLHLEVLTGITWSTDLVLSQTLQRAHAAGLHAVCASGWYDVDTGEALERLRGEVTAPLALAPTRTMEALSLIPLGETHVR
jgi:rSAM/selenodomain-associated transferase 1